MPFDEKISTPQTRTRSRLEKTRTTNRNIRDSLLDGFQVLYIVDIFEI